MRALRYLGMRAQVQLLAGSLLLLLATAWVGLLLGQARASASVPGSDLGPEAALGSARLLGEGEATVAIDEAVGQICVEARVGSGTGGACNALDADPWLFLAGADAWGTTMVVVVDGRRQLETLQADGNGTLARSEDGGLSIRVLLPVPPTTLTAFGADGSVLLEQRPQDEVTAGQAQAASAPVEPEAE